MSRSPVRATTPIEEEKLVVKNPPKKVAGLKAVTNSFKIGIHETGISKTLKTMRSVNRFDGFDCPGCAWPDPDNHRSGFEFCENGAKAFATEATNSRVTPHFFSENSVSSLSEQSDMWLDKQGRITQPMFLDTNEDHYSPIQWDEAFDIIANSINLDTPERVALYTSGRCSNEAAFLWGTLARQIGTNNLPDCSNMCHESSGVALSRSIGIGKGTVTLEDFDHADLVIVVGQNPGTNHPRMLSALSSCKRNGGSVLSINPLEEAAMKRFKHPQEILGMLGRGTQIADDHIPVRINGDSALFKGFAKIILENDSQNHDFIKSNTNGYDDFVNHLNQTGWDDIVSMSGISKDRILEIGNIISKSKSMIVCWAMGITQHKNSVSTIHDIVNLLLLGGHFGRPGAGVCPVRGHSNVQGDRTVGINHHPSESFLSAIDNEFGITSPRNSGVDTVKLIQGALENEFDVLLCMGGNLLSAMSDTKTTAKAISNIGLTVQISTKLNRSHLVTGKQALILPCLGRTEIDQQESGNQFVSVENSMGIVHSSTGGLKPASKFLKSEVAITCSIGNALFGTSPINWSAFTTDYDLIRDSIQRVIPGFDEYNRRVREEGGFYLPNGPRDGPTWKTPSGSAEFISDKLSSIDNSDGYVMMTIRSHDQYNTTIYGMDDRYRGVYKARRIVLMNPIDMENEGIKPSEEIDLVSKFSGIERYAEQWKVVPYSIPRGNIATYFPEANVLIPLDSVADSSNTPTSKSVVVNIVKR
ncbi:MAG: FdhF/YdeP family oxidoreductase [Candidatus Thermoplasmatota archaeon]|nr:FdhF/YdeP family oxidoreductase [Candidatus Thermoplasmatota archaeon]